jgi:hypothetical protein
MITLDDNADVIKCIPKIITPADKALVSAQPDDNSNIFIQQSKI